MLNQVDSDPETQAWERERAKREREEKDEAKRLAQGLTKFLNVMGQDKQRIALLVSELAREHRTLQQSVTALAVGWLEDLAAPERRFDARNEASVLLARKLLEGTDEFDRHLPLI